MQFKSISNTILTAATLLLCGSCSNRDTVDSSTNIEIPSNPNNPNTPENNFSDSQITEMVKKDALKYFWDFAQSNSRLARERYHTDNPSDDANTVTTGGSGFGLMTILVGIKNGYVSQADAVSRLTTALDFLQTANRFHGAWPHWMNGTSGNVIPFGDPALTKDNGGDLVETAFLAQGLICVREYFKNSTNSAELALAQKADDLWKGIEWNWYTKGENALYWHWSPNYDFQMNMKLQGFDETLITYVLAAASPTYSINKAVYQNGWARNGSIKTSGSQFGIPLVVNHNGATGTVGPMFWSHYSFLGLDPRGLSDDYVNYGDATTNHAKVMFQYCVSNPKGWQGYNSKSWGLTASYSRNTDGTTGYSAHQPNNDLGIISPTAAISNMPYTPTESMDFLRFLYNENYSKYVGVAGPYDAYSIQYNWVTPRYLAIDQGTIAPMVENYQSQFLWKLFMNAPDVRQGLVKLGFHSTTYGF